MSNSKKILESIFNIAQFDPGPIKKKSIDGIANLAPNTPVSNCANQTSQGGVVSTGQGGQNNPKK